MITVNGRPRELTEGAVVADLVAELTAGRDGRGVAVAVNGEVVPRGAWATTVITSDDRVEVLTASQGG